MYKNVAKKNYCRIKLKLNGWSDWTETEGSNEMRRLKVVTTKVIPNVIKKKCQVAFKIIQFYYYLLFFPIPFPQKLMNKKSLSVWRW